MTFKCQQTKKGIKKSQSAAYYNSNSIKHSISVSQHCPLSRFRRRLSVGESEKHVISEVSADGLTLTLERQLTFEHISAEQTFAGQTVRMRAEVGLLTRNVKVRGSINDAFTEEVKKCAAGFEPGEIGVWSPVMGRFRCCDFSGDVIMLRCGTLRSGYSCRIRERAFMTRTMLDI